MTDEPDKPTFGTLVLDAKLKGYVRLRCTRCPLFFIRKAPCALECSLCGAPCEVQPDE